MKILLEYLQTAKRLSVKDDISSEELYAIIGEEFRICGDKIKLQIYDQDFQAFCDLESFSEVTHLSRIKIINLESSIILEPSQVVETPTSSPQTIETENLGLRTRTWNNDCKISFSSFDLITSEELKAAEEEFVATGKLHKPSYRLKSQINDVLSNELTKYGLYPTRTMYHDITRTLISTFPSLKEPIGDGLSAWKIALQYRVQEIRRKIKNAETSINSGKRSKTCPNAPTGNSGIKKARRGEINYSPNIPDGETLQTVQDHKMVLIKECSKREPNPDIVSQKMDKTYYLRRADIVSSRLKLTDIKENWSMLFSPMQLRKEVIRILGIDIYPKILMNLTDANLVSYIEKRLKITGVTEEGVLESLPLLFKEKCSFFVKKDAKTLSQCMENMDKTKGVLSPHAVLVQEEDMSWSIMGENVLLVNNMDFVTGVISLICVYYVCDLQYCKYGIKCMTFLQQALAEIPNANKIPNSVLKVLNEMKRGGSV